MSKKRKFVADEGLTRELAEDGYSGVEVRVTPIHTEIIIGATQTQNVLVEKGRRIRDLTSLVQKRTSSKNSITKAISRFDCGMFMIKYADIYSKGLGLFFNKGHMPYFWQGTAKEILGLRAN